MRDMQYSIFKGAMTLQVFKGTVETLTEIMEDIWYCAIKEWNVQCASKHMRIWKSANDEWIMKCNDDMSLLYMYMSIDVIFINWYKN